MKPSTSFLRDRGAAMRKIAVALSCLILTAAVARADSSWVTRQDLLDAILQRGTLTSQQLQELDLTRDGVVDVADLVCLTQLCHKNANFVATQTSVDEATGTAIVHVTFDNPITGTVNYAVTGTAASGSDYGALPGSISVSGGAVDIPVSVVNDGLPEEAEFLTIELRPGTGYSVGALNLHTIHIIDNDGTWHGSLEVAEGRVGIAMSVINATSGTSGSLNSDGVGAFPQGTYAATISLGTSAFSADTAPISLDATASDWAVPFQRAFHFGADTAQNADDRVVAGQLVQGAFTETLTSPGYPHLNRTITGRFTLVKDPVTSSSFLPVLE